MYSRNTLLKASEMMKNMKPVEKYESPDHRVYVYDYDKLVP